MHTCDLQSLENCEIYVDCASCACRLVIILEDYRSYVTRLKVIASAVALKAVNYISRVLVRTAIARATEAQRGRTEKEKSDAMVRDEKQ